MAGLLDVLNNPMMAAAAGLLTPTPGGSFGAGLQQGLAGLQRAQALNQQRSLQDLQAQQAKMAIMNAQQQAEKRKAMDAYIGQRGTTMSGPLQPGQERGLVGGMGILADGVVTPEEQMGLLQFSDNPMNALTQYYAATKPPQGSEFERLDARVQAGTATAGEIARWNKLKDPSAGMSISLSGLADKERTKANVDAENEFINRRGKLGGFVDLTNQVMRRVAAPGATIGTVGSIIRGTDIFRSQLSQVFTDPENYLSGLSMENRDLVERAVQSGEIESDQWTLAFALASQREGGKLTDRDIKAAMDTFSSGSAEQFVAKLVNTRNTEINKFNREAAANKAGRDDAFAGAFAPYEAEPVYGVEAIQNMDANNAGALMRLGETQLRRLLTSSEQAALARRVRQLRGESQ